MFSKEITYKDHDGTERTQMFYFNLTKSEAIQINLMEDLETISKQAMNPRIIVPVLNRVLQSSFGVKLPSGYFTKDPDHVSWFPASDAYSELFLWLLEEGEAETRVADFINAVLGTNVDGQAGRPAPQDHKKKEVDEMPLQNLPSDAHRIETHPDEEPNGLANNEEFQQWLQWKREQDAIKAENSVIPSSPHQSNAD